MGLALISLDAIDATDGGAVAKLFSESNTRFLVEVKANRIRDFEAALATIACTRIGQVTDVNRVTITNQGRTAIDADIHELKQAWLQPLAW